MIQHGLGVVATFRRDSLPWHIEILSKANNSPSSLQKPLLLCVVLRGRFRSLSFRQAFLAIYTLWCLICNNLAWQATIAARFSSVEKLVSSENICGFAASLLGHTLRQAFSGWWSWSARIRPYCAIPVSANRER